MLFVYIWKYVFPCIFKQAAPRRFAYSLHNCYNVPRKVMILEEVFS